MIEVIASGIGTSFQDLGRFGYRKFGVPVSGAMDLYSALFANQALGNSPDTPLIEFALKGPILKFHSPTKICIAGAPFSPKINGTKISTHHAITVLPGDELTIGSSEKGTYGYLAIQHGFKVEKILGSSSYYKTLTDTILIKRGAQLRLLSSKQNKENPTASIKTKPETINNNKIDVYPGPEYLELSSVIQELLITAKMKVSTEINRMGYRIDCANLPGAGEIITAPVQPGTVQLTPSGKLIVLMRDAQTTGGYSRIFQLTDFAISQFAQKRAGDSIFFRLLD